MKRTIKKILAVVVTLALVAAYIVIDPMLFLRSSYVATPPEKLVANQTVGSNLSLTPPLMCPKVLSTFIS